MAMVVMDMDDNFNGYRASLFLVNFTSSKVERSVGRPLTCVYFLIPIVSYLGLPTLVSAIAMHLFKNKSIFV